MNDDQITERINVLAMALGVVTANAYVTEEAEKIRAKAQEALLAAFLKTLELTK